jgi:hypothetical protein
MVLCSKIAEAEAAVSVNEKKWLVMHMHVQLQLDELRGHMVLCPNLQLLCSPHGQILQAARQLLTSLCMLCCTDPVSAVVMAIADISRLFDWPPLVASEQSIRLSPAGRTQYLAVPIITLACSLLLPHQPGQWMPHYTVRAGHTS